MPDVQEDGDKILHQDSVEEVVDERLDGVDAENEVLDDLDAITGGQSPTEGEHNLVVGKLNDILAALRNSRIIPTD